jgi:integrase
VAGARPAVPQRARHADERAHLDRHFKAALVAAGVRLRDTGKRTKKGEPVYTSDLKFHHLRHTALSWLGDAGASDMVLEAIAGHADKNVTDRYVHVSIEAMREAVVRMEREKLLPAAPGAGAQRTSEVG